jgi:predicted nuclease with TOPRIM domain
MKLFRNRKRELVEHLKLEVVNIENKYFMERALKDELNRVNNELVEYANKVKKTLENTLNELTEANKTIEEQKTEIMLLKKEILKKEQLIEIKENQRRKSAGKVGDLTKKIKKLQDEKEGQNEIIKSFARENTNLKGLVKTNKDARAYLRGKAERE